MYFFLNKSSFVFSLFVVVGDILERWRCMHAGLATVSDLEKKEMQGEGERWLVFGGKIIKTTSGRGEEKNK